MTIKVALAHRDQLDTLRMKGGGASTFELAEAAMREPNSLLVAIELIPAASFSAYEPEQAQSLGRILKHQARAVFELRVQKYGAEEALKRADQLPEPSERTVDAVFQPTSQPSTNGRVIVAYADKYQLEKLRCADDAAETFDFTRAQLIDPDSVVVALKINPAASFIGLEIEEAAFLGDTIERSGGLVLAMRRRKVELQAKLTERAPSFFSGKKA